MERLDGFLLSYGDCMGHRLKKWEIALLVGILTALVWGTGTVQAQEELAGQVLRLHVIANSDSAQDQRLKLMVRDAVLEQIETSVGQADSVEGMTDLLRGQLAQLEEVGEEVLREAGCEAPVCAEVTNCYFPTKVYEGFALPAGEYTALRLTIGNGEGQNWWCVAFPPLCAGASAQSVEEAVKAGYFTTWQGDLLTGQGDGYQLRFKSMELLGALKEALFGLVA